MERVGFFRRERLEFDAPETGGGGNAAAGGYVQAKCANVDELLFAPVVAGHWKHHELWDGTYDLDDLLDILEVMQVKAENERRAHEQAEIEAEMKRGQNYG